MEGACSPRTGARCTNQSVTLERRRACEISARCSRCPVFYVFDRRWQFHHSFWPCLSCSGKNSYYLYVIFCVLNIISNISNVCIFLNFIFLIQVSIFSHLEDSRFEHFRPVMDAYIKGHFAAALVYK